MEETAILFEAHVLERGGGPVTVILWPLHECDPLQREERQRAAEPERLDLVIAVDDGDVRGVRIGEPECLVQRAGLESLQSFDVMETKTFAQSRAMRFDRTPGRRFGRVVVENDDLKIFVIEPRQGVQGSDHHRWRFVVAGNMYGNPQWRFGNGGPEHATLHAPKACRELDAFGEDHSGGEKHERDHR